MNYAVPPGLYGVGNPGEASPVLVSANYKMSFDALRSELTGLDAWILVINTFGINVWCAAGKGTFSTQEILIRMAEVQLDQVVTHRQIIVPQLGAPGVASQEIKKTSGFRVVYGPVRALDLPAFLEAGKKATPEMRRVRFPLADRAVLIPLEIVMGWKALLIALIVLLGLSGLGPDGYDARRLATVGAPSVGLFALDFLSAAVLVPLLLPWLPGRAFSVKGIWTGLICAGGLAGAVFLWPGLKMNPWTLAGWIVFLPALTSFVGMNFTGASTFTSLSGVYREMKIALPVQGLAGLSGLGLWIAGRFL